jgi:hypothetical protein
MGVDVAGWRHRRRTYRSQAPAILTSPAQEAAAVRGARALHGWHIRYAFYYLVPSSPSYLDVRRARFSIDGKQHRRHIESGACAVINPASIWRLRRPAESMNEDNMAYAGLAE